MKIIETSLFQKLAYPHLGTQPGFAASPPQAPDIVRDLLAPETGDLSENSIKEIWGKDKKRRKKKKKRIIEEIPDQPF